jgi:hypothetical protein
VKCIDFVITRCRFENFGNGAVSVLHEDNLASGLIYKCEFVHNCKGYDALGLGYGVVVYGVNSIWIPDPKFGSGNFIFVEDNIFDYHRHSIAGGGCALYVFRYNTVKNNIAGNTAHAIDAHEARLEAGGNYYSSRAIEVYNNSVINTMFRDGTSNCPNGTLIVAGKSPGWLVECAIRTRGGEALIHDNYIEGYRFGVGLITPKLTSYPSPYQQGYLSAAKYGATHTGVDSDKANGDVFIWNDTYKSYAPTNSQCVYFYNYTPDYIVAERDYHLFAKVGYTPYTYPHPLRNTTTPTSPLALTTSSTNVSCNAGSNGSATVTATGGAGGFTYNWSSSPIQTTATASNLTAGTYTVTVKDAAGTSKTATVTINQPTAITLTTTTTPDSCGKKNGTSTAVVSGGTAPYTYSWTTLPIQTTVTATGLTTGGYTVTVTDKNGCTASAKSIVPLVAAPTVSTTTTPDSCGKKNGTSTAIVSGGTAPYIYSWTTLPIQTTVTATSLTTGGYTVTVTDKNGCTASAKSIVPLVAAPTVTTTTTPDNCGRKDGTSTAVVSGGTAPYTYSWTTLPIQTTATATGLTTGGYTVTVTDNNGCTSSIKSIVPLVAAPTVTTTTTPDYCGRKDGTSTAVVSGGTAPYIYSWTTLPIQTGITATGLTTGGYTVTVTDKNGCSASIKSIVPLISGPSVSTTMTTENCGKKDGTATAVVSGGTAPYTYSWTTIPVQTTATATGLSAGGYTVTVSDQNRCSVSAPVVVAPTAPLSVTTSLTSENCRKKDGTATAIVSGGNAPYTYAWTTIPIKTTATATGLTAGGYTVTVTDRTGCSKSVAVVIGRSYISFAAAVTSKDVSCNSQNNGTAAVNVTEGVAPYTYEWNTVPAQFSQQATNLEVGEYEVVVTDAVGCQSRTAAKIGKAQPQFTLATVQTDASCETCKDGTASVIVSGQPATYTYTWSAPWNMTLSTTNSAIGLSVGSYSITVSDNNGCFKQATAVISSSMTTGIVAEAMESEDITLFPNPTQSKFNITNGDFKPAESVLVVLYNTAGVEVYSKILVKEGEVIAVDTENRLEPGIYVVVASSQDHLYKKKIIITQ